METFQYNRLSFGITSSFNVEHGCSSFFVKTPDENLLRCNDVDLMGEEHVAPVVRTGIMGAGTLGFAGDEGNPNKYAVGE